MKILHYPFIEQLKKQIVPTITNLNKNKLKLLNEHLKPSIIQRIYKVRLCYNGITKLSLQLVTQGFHKIKLCYLLSISQLLIRIIWDSPNSPKVKFCYKFFSCPLKVIRILLIKCKKWGSNFISFISSTFIISIKKATNSYYKLLGLCLLALLLQGCAESCLDKVYRSTAKTGKPAQIIDRGSSPILGTKCEVIYYDEK